MSILTNVHFDNLLTLATFSGLKTNRFCVSSFGFRYTQVHTVQNIKRVCLREIITCLMMTSSCDHLMASENTALLWKLKSLRHVTDKSVVMCSCWTVKSLTQDWINGYVVLFWNVDMVYLPFFRLLMCKTNLLSFW